MKEIITSTMGILFMIPFVIGFSICWFFASAIHKWQRTQKNARLEQKVRELEADR